MSPYTISDVQEADQLWDEMPLGEVADELGIPEPTLRDWAKHGWISTDVDHRKRAIRKYDSETIRRADRLWDTYPIRVVSNILDVPEGTLYHWSAWGWINTTANHAWNPNCEGLEERIRRAAHLVHDQDLTQREAAERMGLSEATISRYLKRYRTGEYA